ncbi:MAG: AAA family ATPase [Rhodospirillales bacterium]|nr:AAA family ATPase [Rhodospirillales bacterium]
MIVVIGGEKGGTGKTTIATHMAYMRALSGRKVILVDCDPQRSATNFVAVRDEEGREPRIPCMQKVAPRGLSEAAAMKGICADILGLAEVYDDVIVDTGGRDSVELKAAMGAADRIYVPVLASQYDLWTLETIDGHLQRLGSDELVGRVVFTSMPVIPGFAERKVRRAREGLAQFNIQKLTMSDAVIHHRNYFQLTVEYGATVFEDLPAEDQQQNVKASQELMQLYVEMFEESQAEWVRRAKESLGLDNGAGNEKARGGEVQNNDAQAMRRPANAEAREA